MSGLWRETRRWAGISPERKGERHGGQQRIDNDQSRFGLLEAEERTRRRLGARKAAKTMQARLGGGFNGNGG